LTGYPIVRWQGLVTLIAWSPNPTGFRRWTSSTTTCGSRKRPRSSASRRTPCGTGAGRRRSPSSATRSTTTGCTGGATRRSWCGRSAGRAGPPGNARGGSRRAGERRQRRGGAMSDAKRTWITVTESRYPWERDALDFVRDRWPDHDPYRAWANFEFIALDGSINEVDLLLL